MEKTDTLHSEPERDQFKSESPIRAFTDWTTQGGYALGKGFRPSLAHVIPYMDAMRTKEGWRLVQILEAGTQTPSFIFEREREIGVDVMLDRLASGNDEGFRQKVKDWLATATHPLIPVYHSGTDFVPLPYLSPVDPRKIATGLRQVTADMLDDAERAAQHGDRYFIGASELQTYADRLNGYAAELHDEPYVRNRAGFEEAGQKIGAARALSDAMDAIPPEVQRTYTFDGLDTETTHHLRGTWTAKLEILWTGLASMKGQHRANFLKREKADDPKHYWDTASVASVLRLIDKLDWWDRIGLANGITYPEMSKALGREIDWRSPVAAACHMLISPEVTSETVTFPDTRRDDDPAAHNHPWPQLAQDTPTFDDPINPKHYAGRECADIGERLSANGYQILKYCWRLGKKDDPCQELGKALWYAQSEAALLVSMKGLSKASPMIRPNVFGMKPEEMDSFLEDRIADQPTFTQNIARMLWNGYNKRRLQAIIEAITEHKFHMDCGRGLAI